MGCSRAVFIFAALLPACGGVALSPPVEPQTIDSPLAGTVGVFTFRPYDAGGPHIETVLTAAFQTETPQTCTTIESGFCVRKDCLNGHTNFELEHAQAGRITASSGDRRLVVEPQAEGPYRAEFGTGALWETNSPILIEAAGGTISGFRTELLGPTHVKVTEPEVSRDAILSVPRGCPFELGWDTAEEGDVLAILSSDSTETRTTITCTYPIEQGAGFIPSDLFDGLNAENKTMRLSVGVLQSQLIDVDGQLIDVVAFASGTTPSGGDAAFTLRFIAP